jgi:hypothetical protein
MSLKIERMLSRLGGQWRSHEADQVRRGNQELLHRISIE